MFNRWLIMLLGPVPVLLWPISDLIFPFRYWKWGFMLVLQKWRKGLNSRWHCIVVLSSHCHWGSEWFLHGAADRIKTGKLTVDNWLTSVKHCCPTPALIDANMFQLRCWCRRVCWRARPLKSNHKEITPNAVFPAAVQVLKAYCTKHGSFLLST